MKYREHRYATRFPVVLKQSGASYQATISSVSSSGAAMVIDELLNKDAPVIVEYSGAKVPAKIVWIDRNRTGPRFVVPLSISQVDRIRFGVKTSTGRQTHSNRFSEMR